MQRRQVLLVDAFADEPTGGRPIVVDPVGGLADSQRRAVASELGTSGVVTMEDDVLQYIDCDGSQAVVSAAVAGAAGLYNRGALEPGAFDIETAGETAPVEIDQTGTVTVGLPSLVPAEADLALDEIAAALDIDVAAMQDVGADLPAARVDAFGGTLLVPVNFLQHVSGATPTAHLPQLLDSTDVARAVVFTFDTLSAQTDVHLRLFDPRAAGDERAASGIAAGACVSHLAAESMFDGDREEIAIECGQFVDRPATIHATVSTQPKVGGTALTTLDAEIAVPDDEDDDIIEV